MSLLLHTTLVSRTQSHVIIKSGAVLYGVELTVAAMALLKVPWLKSRLVSFGKRWASCFTTPECFRPERSTVMQWVLKFFMLESRHVCTQHLVGANHITNHAFGAL